MVAAIQAVAAVAGMLAGDIPVVDTSAAVTQVHVRPMFQREALSGRAWRQEVVVIRARGQAIGALRE